MKSIAEFTNAFESMESAGAEQARRADYNHEWALEVERERDDALRKLESLEESITSLDHPNIRILLRQAESYALDVAEKHEKRYCEIKKQLADSNVHLENITIERDSERALADRLADALMSTRWDSPVICKEAIAAWKEARSEVKEAMEL